MSLLCQLKPRIRGCPADSDFVDDAVSFVGCKIECKFGDFFRCDELICRYVRADLCDHVGIYPAGADYVNPYAGVFQFLGHRDRHSAKGVF